MGFLCTPKTVSAIIEDMEMLSIAEASQLTGKSQITIRRLIKRLISQDNQKSSQLINLDNTGYRIEKSYLLEQVSSQGQDGYAETNHHEYAKSTHVNSQTTMQNEQVSSQVIKAKDETIALLTEQLKKKDEQIAELLQRDKERNILFHKFQDALMLEAPKNTVAGSVAEQPQNVKAKPQKFKKREKPTTPPEKKKGLFSWFRK
jgi:hypothetical protein